MHPIPLDPARVADPRTPIMFIVDDPAPIAHVYRSHVVDVHKGPAVTRDGRPLLEDIPNDVLAHFADVIQRWGIRGKYSIVPGLGGRGDLVHGINGRRVEEIRAWLDIARTRLAPQLDFCPEMITHNLTVDLEKGGFLPLSEVEWSFSQTAETLTPYITGALQMLKDAGIEATGVTSPWDFGSKVEPAYQRAIIAAMKAVYGKDRSWYFLHMKGPEARPELVVSEPPTQLVSIPCTMNDFLWQTIDSTRADRDHVLAIADQFLTIDGKAGAIRDSLRASGSPILVTHWQSLFSNGLETGIAILDEVGKRVQDLLRDEVVWCSASEVMERTIRDAGQ
jgi:hypothetical protein